MVAFYATCVIFIFVVLGFIARLGGFSIFKFIRYIKEEMLIVLGTSSSESVLPRMMEKLETPRLRQVGGRPGHPDRLLVQSRRHVHLPDDGGACSSRRPTNADLTLWQQLGIVGVLLLTSKGAAARDRLRASSRWRRRWRPSARSRVAGLSL